jgi:hypothetical protein
MDGEDQDPVDVVDIGAEAGDVQAPIGAETMGARSAQWPPGGDGQAADDADTFFAQEVPALQEWRFGREEAERSGSPNCCSWRRGRQLQPVARLQRRVRTGARLVPTG